MGRSLLLLAALAAAVVLVRPRGPRQADGLQGWSWLAVGLSKDRLLGDGVARLAFLDDRLVWGVAGLHVASSPGDMLVAMGCLLTLGEELWRSARTSRRLRPDGRPELEGPQGATVKGG